MGNSPTGSIAHNFAASIEELHSQQDIEKKARAYMSLREKIDAAYDSALETIGTTKPIWQKVLLGVAAGALLFGGPMGWMLGATGGFGLLEIALTATTSLIGGFSGGAMVTGIAVNTLWKKTQEGLDCAVEGYGKLGSRLDALTDGVKQGLSAIPALQGEFNDASERHKKSEEARTNKISLLRGTPDTRVDRNDTTQMQQLTNLIMLQQINSTL